MGRPRERRDSTAWASTRSSRGGKVVVLPRTRGYLRQGGDQFSQSYPAAGAARQTQRSTRLLVRLFESGSTRRSRAARRSAARRSPRSCGGALDGCQPRPRPHPPLLLALIEATLRTNYFQYANRSRQAGAEARGDVWTEEGRPRTRRSDVGRHAFGRAEASAETLCPTSCSSSHPSGCPWSRAAQKFEIWVYSPRLEAVHLRFGAVARGGLRWSNGLRTSAPRYSAWSRPRR